jgi:hypothetical protein
LALFKFDLDPGAAWFESGVESGHWDTSSFKRWGVVHDEWEGLRMNTWQGKSVIEEHRLYGNLSVEPGEWYYLLFAVNQGAEFVARVWERDDPSKYSDYRKTFDEEWEDHGWIFVIGVGSGKLYVDTFTEISFTEIR